MAHVSLRKYDLLIIAAGIIAVAVHVSTFRHFYTDDALISLRYAQRLLDGQGLTWTDGPRVEGYSNLLWTLACALLGWFGVDLIVASRVLGALGIAAVLAALVYHRVTSRTESAIPFAIGVAACALAGPVAAWTLAGLETPFVAAFLVWGFVLLIQSPLSTRACTAAGVCFGLLSVTRPDGPLFVMIGAAWLAFSPGVDDRRRKVVSFLFWPIVLVTAQLVFRLAYYGDWVPNVYHIKVSPSLQHLLSGAKYVWRGMAGLLPASLLAVYGLWVVIRRDPTRRPQAALVLVAIVAWLGYIVFIGGDIFPGRRHMVPFVALMSVGFVIVLEWLVSAYRWQNQWTVALIAALGLFVTAQSLDTGYRKARAETWVWNAEVVGRALNAAFGEKQPLLAVTAAGGIPYWSKLPCIDMLGLNDAVIARSKSQGKGSNWIGHEQADANYVMSRRPELIHFGAPGGGMPVFGYKEQMKDMPVFWQDYVLCAIGGLKPYPFVTRIYVDRTSTKLGLISTPGHIDVPLYLIEGTVAMWFEDAHRFVTRLEPRRPAGIRALSLDAGKWQIGIPPGVEAQLVDSQNGTVIATGITGDTVITLVAPVTANLIVRVTGTKFIELYELVLSRQP